MSRKPPQVPKLSLRPPKEELGTRRKSAVLASVTLTAFERSYLEKLRNKEHPHVCVHFASAPTPDADFIFHSTSPCTPKYQCSSFKSENNRFRRKSAPFIDPSENARLERELAVPKYKSYVKSISKSMRSFDATFSKISEKGSCK